MMQLIETSHLKTWAASVSARSQFPRLIKNLIYAVIQPDKIRFPSGDAVWVPGFDGYVVNKEKNRFVPKGLSLWEAGVGSNYKTKANDDFNKRSDISDGSNEEKQLPELDRSKATFVFVTPHVWIDKEIWVNEKKGENIWYDVVVIDGVDLQEWLEAAPAVSLQFAAESLGIVPGNGLWTPEQAWEDWSYLTKPPQTEELVIVGREEQEKEFIARLSDRPNTFIVRGDSPREAFGFALACLRRVETGEQRQNLFARTIIADNQETASKLRNVSNHIILLKQASEQVSGHPNSHIIIPEGNDARSTRNVINLSRPTRQPFVEALINMGFEEESAEREARSCGLSVTIFQRQCACANFTDPPWSTAPNVRSLIPALLSSRWDENNDEDKEILIKLAGAEDYETVTTQIHDFLFVDERPLQKIGSIWALTAPVDVFQLLARRLTSSDMNRFKEAFIEVFGKINPRVEVSRDEWLYYDLRGDQLHSDWLRSGMAEILLLIAERGEDAQLLCVPSTKDFVDNVVRELPGLFDDWRLLASIRDQYARLLEAAPCPFLDSLEQLIETKTEDIKKLFSESENVLSIGSMHTGLLWGLETLAWSQEYLSRVSLILAKLASIDPGGKLLNRPINSLYEIFLWWHPSTNASTKERLLAIDLILSCEPEIGMELLTRLLPNYNSSISHQTSKPRWKDCGDLPEDSKTRRGQLLYLSEIIDRLLENIGSNPNWWAGLLESLNVISDDQRKKAMANLSIVANEQTIKNEEKSEIWKILREFVCKHRTYNDAPWALPDEIIEELDKILSQLTPDDLVEKYLWLFNEWFPQLPSGEKDLDERKRAVKELRQRAANEILEKLGYQGIVSFGIACKFPGWLASAVVPLINSQAEILKLIEKAILAGDNGINFAGQLSGQAEQLYGEEWCEIIKSEIKNEKWHPKVSATLMSWWPDNRSTWHEIEALGEEVESQYWRLKWISNLEGTPEDQKYQIEHLIQAERATEVFDRLSLKEKKVDSELMLRVFDATFTELSRIKTTEDARRLGIHSHDVQEFLNILRNRSDIDPQEIALREYQALPLLSLLSAKGLTIQKFMADDPTFFIRIICDAFLPRNRDKDQKTEPTPEEAERAKIAYRMLNGMDVIPGQQEGNQINEDVLLEWIRSVQEKAVEVDRSEITDLKIGEILAHSPEDPTDGGWPHQSIRYVIEKVSTKTLEEGIITGRYNLRGTYTKSLYEGGAQESELADQYESWAKISSKWPKISKVLLEIAKGYQKEAKQADERVEQMKLK